jgi:aryl-alcohol dehydrogenase-like predicted oxidoreductase
MRAVSDHIDVPLRTQGSRPLGGSGLEVGPLGYGCWRLAEGDVVTAQRNIATALDAGMTLIDTADVYGLDSDRPFGTAESLLGEVLAAHPNLRSRMVLATKGGIVPGVPYDASARWLRTACEGSLRRLGVDHIDLYQVHRLDLLTHPGEVAATLTALRQAGMIREAGLSNVTAAQFEAVAAHCDFPLVTNQPEFSLQCPGPLYDGLLDQCMRLGVTPLAWSALGGGTLALPRSDIVDPRTRATVERLDEMAIDRGVPRTAVALAWVLAHPSAPVALIGSQQPDRLVAATRALEVRLDRTDWYELLQCALGERLP